MQQLCVGDDTGILRDYGSYDFPYRYNLTTAAKLVREISLKGLLERYGDILWQPGSHKYNVNNFIGELHEILENPLFTIFSQDMLDGLIGKLRNRGNSNATINRKMAALRKLLCKAHKMGDIHSLPEFRREKEKAGRIRFLAHEQERRLFEAIGKESEVYQRLYIFLVDTGARLGEGLGLQWRHTISICACPSWNGTLSKSYATVYRLSA
jgi:integrase